MSHLSLLALIEVNHNLIKLNQNLVENMYVII